MIERDHNEFRHVRLIPLTNGTELDASVATLQSLIRLREEDLQRVLDWLEGERAALAARIEENEKRVRKIQADMAPQIEENHRSAKEWVARNW